VAGGTADDSEGFFAPTVIQVSDPQHALMRENLAVLAVYVFDDGQWDAVVQLVDGPAYALTGAVFARDRQVLAQLGQALRLPPATSTSTTSPRAPWWGSSPSVVRAAAARTTRLDRPGICCAGCHHARSRRRICPHGPCLSPHAALSADR
jgi:hypothetical protein